jgi:hypothetical protein
MWLPSSMYIANWTGINSFNPSMGPKTLMNHIDHIVNSISKPYQIAFHSGCNTFQTITAMITGTASFFDSTAMLSCSKVNNLLWSRVAPFLVIDSGMQEQH